jgi:hypothetical protein
VFAMETNDVGGDPPQLGRCSEVEHDRPAADVESITGVRRSMDGLLAQVRMEQEHGRERRPRNVRSITAVDGQTPIR